MSDKQNKSNNQSINGHFTWSSMEDVGKNIHQSMQQEQLRQRTKVYQSQWEAFEQNYPLSIEEMMRSGNPDLILIGKKFERLNQTIAANRIKIRMASESEQIRATSQAMNRIGRLYTPSAIHGATRRMYEDVDVQSMARGMGGLSYDELTRMKGEASEYLSYTGSAVQETTRDLYRRTGKGLAINPKVQNEIETVFGESEGLVKKIAAIDLAMRGQRSQGRDKLSQFDDLFKTIGKAEKLLNIENIGQEVGRGTVNITRKGETVAVKTEDLRTELIRESQNLINTFKKLGEVTERSQDEISKFGQTTDDTEKKLSGLQKKLEQHKENVDKLEQAESSRGGGTPSSAGRFARYASILGAVSSGAYVAQDLLVNQKIQDVQNIAGYAGIENQKYSLYKAARHGDVAAQLMLAQSMSTEDFAKSVRQTVGFTEAVGGFAGGAAQIAGGLAATAAGAAAAPETGGLSALISTAGLGFTVSGMGQLLKTGKDVMNGTTSGRVQQQSYSVFQGALQQLQAIPAEQIQGLRDFYMGSANIALGMGTTRGENLLNKMVGKGSTDLLSQMAAAGISPTEMVNLSGLGVSEMGSVFDPNQVLKAKMLESRNLGTAQQNIMRMGVLAGAGANNPSADLETIIASGMTKGLDSSKAIDALVQNSAGTAMKDQAAVLAGADIAGAAGRFASSLIDPNQANVNQEAATRLALSNQELANKYSTNTSSSFSGMLNLSRTADIAKKYGIQGDLALSSKIMAERGIEFWQAVQGERDPNKQRKMLESEAIYLKDPSKISDFTSAMLRTKLLAAGEGGGAAMVAGGLSRRDIDNLTKGTVSEADRPRLAQIAKAAGYDPEQYFRMWQTTGAPGGSSTVNAKPGELTEQMTRMRTEGAKQETQAAQQGFDNLKKITDQLKTQGINLDPNQLLTALTTGASVGGKKGREAETEFSGAAVKAAATLGDAGAKLSSGVDKFDAVMTKWTKQSGIPMVESTPNKPLRVGSPRRFDY